MAAHRDDEVQELARLRHRLDIMDDMRHTGGLRPLEEAAYGELCRIEVELLDTGGSDETPDPLRVTDCARRGGLL